MYDLAIIGGGPAGVAAGVYAARKRLKTVFITESFGGQSTDSMGIENWIGTTKISGVDFAKMLEAHLRAYAEDMVHIKVGEWVSKVSGSEGDFNISLKTILFQSYKEPFVNFFPINISLIKNKLNL